MKENKILAMKQRNSKENNEVLRGKFVYVI